MTTDDLQYVDELVVASDMAVRIASQMRLWKTRKIIRDEAALTRSIAFLDEALSGGSFLKTGEVARGSSASLHPLTWSADTQSQFMGDRRSAQKISYDELTNFLTKTKSTLELLKSGATDKLDDSTVEDAASFFESLGKLLGGKADSSLSRRAISTRFPEERFSYQ